MFGLIQKWGSFVRFSHTVFALPFALSALVVAARDSRGWPGWRTFGLVLAAMVCARTCAMAFNRIVDRKFDALNPRTAARHLPAGQMHLASAVTLCALAGAGFIVTSYFLNPLCFYLSPLAIIVICFYSLTKRFTSFTHIFLGLALALAPVGAWLAVKGSGLRDSSASQMLVLALAVVLWLTGFDIIYALQDYEFDRSHGLHSLVVAWGPGNALQAAFLAHLPCAASCLSLASMPVQSSLSRRLAIDRRVPAHGTLGRAPQEPELGPASLFPLERCRQHHIPRCNHDRGGFQRRISLELKTASFPKRLSVLVERKSRRRGGGDDSSRPRPAQGSSLFPLRVEPHRTVLLRRKLHPE